MSARILKHRPAQDFAPFQIPEIGAGNFFPAGIQNFELPAAADFAGVDGGTPSGSAPAAAAIAALSQTDAGEILENARREAARIIAAAEENSRMIEEAAREKGLQEIEQKIIAGTEENLSEIRRDFAESIERIASLQKEISERVEKDLVELSLEIAKKIVGREVKVDREIALTLVRVSLQKLDERTDARIHLNPEDFEYVAEHRRRLEFRGTLELVEDASISVGGCLVETGTGDIDARIEAQFEEIAHGLLAA